MAAIAGLSRRRSRVRSHHPDHTTTFAEPSKPNEPALTAADNRVNHAPRMRVRSGLDEPVHRLNKPFPGTRDAFVGGLYMPMESDRIVYVPAGLG
jgi:hypothetical protein